ncbi:ABC transporter ATP-binding protein [Blastococcus tunisiensis]|uniref:Iron(III) transport system ATP-binding protein n=1 Tax=Blastococcus tunisiensis TaxID=1798228 RepID=A0A1I1WNB5_9ACTN|nr:ABC transporter ATP-binding protein [Blastococcus sp. DSM 46838]SFD95878.1 iron(III) transport system ATP-binding protein [Blastococcus sp. DSM 46838]
MPETINQTSAPARAREERPVTGASVVVEDLRIKYGETEAVKGISFSIAPGEFVTLLGPSGCGKSTTLRCIAGLEPPSAGRITIDGQVVATAQNQVPPERRGVNMVFQSYAVWPHMTVTGNVGYGLAKMPRIEAQARVAEVLDLVGLSPYASRYGTELSGGQQQRVALARAIVTRPKVILFDEPLSNLDAGLREQMRFELLELQRTVGVTSIYVTHDQTEAMSMSDRVVLLRDGLIEQEAAPREIYRRPRSRFVAEFVGRANMIGGTVAEGGRTLTTELPGVTVTGAEGADEPVGARSVAVFRSEDVLLGDAAGGCENRWPATVERVTFLGRFLDVTLDVGGTVVRAELRADAAVAEGERTTLGVRAADVHFVPAAEL